MPGVTVLVADDRRDAIEGIAAALRAAGMQVGQVLPATGVITGAVADAAGLEHLAAVDGVAAVEPAKDVHIAPPDAPVQ
jgi:hypothetical protein